MLKGKTNAPGSGIRGGQEKLHHRVSMEVSFFKRWHSFYARSYSLVAELDLVLHRLTSPSSPPAPMPQPYCPGRAYYLGRGSGQLEAAQGSREPASAGQTRSRILASGGDLRRQDWPGSLERGERAVAPRARDWKIPVMGKGGRGEVDSWEADFCSQCHRSALEKLP